MKWLAIICIFLSVGSQQKCQQKSTTDKANTTMAEGSNKDAAPNGQLDIFGKWAEAGIDEEGRVFKLPPRRGGLEFYTFDADGSIKYEGAVNCGMGNYYLGTYTIDNKMRITTTYTKKKQYIGEKEIEDVDFSQKFSIIRFDEKVIVLELMSSMGDVKVLPLIPYERYKALEYNEFVD